MSYQVLARKWRPRNFTELVGQEHVQRALVNALDNDRLHHAYLFTGTRGVGKTTIARIFAKSLNCENGRQFHPCGECSACVEINEGRFIDLVEVDAASRTKVEDTRELLENVQYAPTRGRYKVYLIDEVHMLSGHSFNALLKTLEEPPPHVKFLLATTDPQTPAGHRAVALPAVQSQEPDAAADHRPARTHPERGEHRGRVRGAAPAGAGRQRQHARCAQPARSGHRLRRAASSTRRRCAVCWAPSTAMSIYRLLEALAASDAATLLAEIGKADDFAPDYAALLADLVSVLQRVALAQTLPDAIDDSHGDRAAVLELAGKLAPEDVQLFYQIGLIGRRDLPLCTGATWWFRDGNAAYAGIPARGAGSRARATPA